MTDFHVHIGQWFEKYFYAEEVFAALKERGVTECWFSSTTSCVFAPPQELYKSVRDEIKNALCAARQIGIAAHALYWVVPDIVQSGISIEQAMSEVPYEGFKIHPRAQEWSIVEKSVRSVESGELSSSKSNLNSQHYKLNSEYFTLLKRVFSYAEEHGLRILIHTGDDAEVDSPRKFEPLIAAHPNCLVQLAHLKDLDAQEYMLKTYANVVADSSFSSAAQVEELTRRGIDKNRILWGSDIPVTYWFENREKLQSLSEPSEELLARHYAKIAERRKT